MVKSLFNKTGQLYKVMILLKRVVYVAILTESIYIANLNGFVFTFMLKITVVVLGVCLLKSIHFSTFTTLLKDSFLLSSLNSLSRL